LRRLLLPRHFLCIPDKKLAASQPKWLDRDPVYGKPLIPDIQIKDKDLSKSDLEKMPDGEDETKLYLHYQLDNFPYGWWDLKRYTYKF